MQFKKSLASKTLSLLTLTQLSACELLSSKGFREQPERALVYLNQSESAFVMADLSQCNEGLRDFYFDFQSPYGHHKGLLSIDHGHQAIHISIDGTDLSLPEQNLFSPDELSSICGSSSKGGRVLSSQDKDKAFLSVLNQVSSCSFSYSETGLHCRLPEYAAYKSKTEIEKLEKKLFRFRQRHPYLLARKVALTSKLQKAANRNSDKAVAELCELARLSDKIELPLPLTSQEWKKQVCSENADPKLRQKALSSSFYESHKSLESLLDHFRKTRTGVFTVRIPRDESPSKDYWVKIEPETLEIENPSTNTCFWHPLYKSSHALMLYSNLVDNIPAKASCLTQETLEPEQLIMELSSHISDNVCSETEFAISNGRGKVLALPKGTYKYELKQHYGLFSKTLKKDNANLDSSAGSFKWSRRRPYPTVRKF